MNTVSGNSMNIFQMTSQVTTLSKSFLTKRAFEGSESSMLAEMVSQVATFLEDTATVRILTFEVELHPLGFRVLNSDSLMPLFRYPFKRLVFVSS